MKYNVDKYSKSRRPTLPDPNHRSKAYGRPRSKVALTNLEYVAVLRL